VKCHADSVARPQRHQRLGHHGMPRHDAKTKPLRDRCDHKRCFEQREALADAAPRAVAERKISSGGQALGEAVEPAVVRKNSIRRSSDRDVGTYLFGFRELENPRGQPRRQKHFSAGLTVCHPDSPCLDSSRTQSAHWSLCLT
jgi:hypothetical protein